MEACNILIQLKDIEFSYETRKPVLSGLNLTLKVGEKIGLLGPNGSGKTTVLSLIVGLLKPQQGSIEVFGKKRVKEKDFYEVREHIGFLFQNPEDQLFCPTVLEDVAFGPLNLGKTRKEAEEIARKTLAILGLSGFENRITHHLSGGEKRLVSLATVLAMKPKILLLDEPIAGLDEETSEKITRILEELPQERIIVSHEPPFLGRTTNKTLILRNGNIKEQESSLDTHKLSKASSK